VAYVAVAAGTFFLAFVTLFVEFVVLLVVGSHAQSRLVPDRASEAAYQEQVADWQRRILEYETAEQQREAAADMWFPVPVNPQVNVVTVFGGAAVSLLVLLATLGTSLLGSGRVVVVDLTRRRSTNLLEEFAESDSARFAASRSRVRYNVPICSPVSTGMR